MPVRGKTEPNPYQPLYFRSLKELDAWVPGQSAKYDGILKYRARKPDLSSATRGKLLVCHDYKGGYNESSFARSYTFNFWSTCETFVYFSHHRVTIPPPGWITAAHRQGVKMLGVLIFEGGGEEDSLRLIVGKMPTSQLKTGQVDQTSPSFTLPLSTHYAKVLAELARERGFDGYLLNFEVPLGGGYEQTRALAAWITVLQAEILQKVGPHGETVWYDSVIINGQLAWQDRLNSYNLPFFLSSTTFFSNYTWQIQYPALTAQYFMSLDPALIGNTPTSQTQLAMKTLQDIYMGVDVWGRGTHGGGGLGSYKAIEHISPDSLGLSVAFFAPAWTWETEEDKEGWDWDQWWRYDSTLWVGPASGTVTVPDMPPPKKGEDPCTHDSFVPVAAFFPTRPPPDPVEIRFHTVFCPGTGLAWFVDGVKVFQSDKGWTDVDKQTSVGNLLWPRPKLYWDDDRDDTIPTALSSFQMDDAWNGGNSVKISISCPGSADDTAAYRPLWLPVQTMSITPRRTYEASAIYKIGHDSTNGVDTEFALTFKAAPGSADDLVCNITSSTSTELPGGWTKLTIQFNTSGSDETVTPPSTIAMGLVVAILTEEPTQSLEIMFLIGQLNVSAHLPDSYLEDDPLILWADYAPTATPSRAAAPFFGTLSWDVASTFPPVPPITIISPEDPVSAWNLQPTIEWFPTFLYFNIYAQKFVDPFTIGTVDKATWIGTSGAGWSGQENAFSLLLENLPFEVDRNTKVRFYVQGITDHGEALKWERCAYVDVPAVLPL
ncbi:hypothetical protein NLJ89_g5891 [Agrocybe chaxingu]|uniref:Cytosolic endo-beta-N-acetylglucosaminidase TIM barrel domain-containing protein n=1 Tax=Agrocybe chaxingu TaxID=84603 RepID=A0A9W8K0D5_9AGAR|nr:hypothetical protein NLJ89_g5891 [Agrocybe chaxingu]